MDAEEDELFRREFISKMSTVLGISSPPKLQTRRILSPQGASPERSLVNALKSVKSEIEHFKALVEKYEKMAQGVASEKAAREAETLTRNGTSG